MGTRTVLISSVYVVEENGQISYDFFTIGLNDAQMLPLTQEQINPYVFQCLPDLIISQLSKVLKRQIKNNDAFSIQLKLQTQVDVDVETT